MAELEPNTWTYFFELMAVVWGYVFLRWAAHKLAGFKDANL